MPVNTQETAEKTLRMIGWQVAVGILFIAFGLEITISDAIVHSLQPFGHNDTVANFSGGGLASNVLFVVGSLCLGVATSRFASVLQKIASKFAE